MASFPRIPINPRLIFGESIENVCTRGRLHPGLKELFTKAYFSAHPNECLIDDDGILEENLKSSPGAWILTILKFAQGDVALRLSLKRRLETGRWLMPLQVPPAAPLWLIRHFLGRLRTPLIFCHITGTCETEAFKQRWILLSKDCHAAMCYHTFNHEIHLQIRTKIAEVMEEMQLEACLTLISLTTLIRNLSYEPTQDWIDKQAVKALVDYFVPALISRPYRPGYFTKEDKECRIVLCYLCHNLPEIQAICKRQETRNDAQLIFDSSSSVSILEQQSKRLTSLTGKKVISEDLKTPLTKTDGLDSEKLHKKRRTSPETTKVISEDLEAQLSKPYILNSEKLCGNGEIMQPPSVMIKVMSEDLKSPSSETDGLDCKKLHTNEGIYLIVKKAISEDLKSSVSKTAGIGAEELHETRETSQKVNKVTSEDLEIPLSGTYGPKSDNLQRPPFLMSKNICTPELTTEDGKKDVQKKYNLVTSPISLETRDGDESKGNSTDSKLLNRNSEKEVVNNQKLFTIMTREDSHVALPFNDEQEKITEDDDMEYTSNDEKNATQCSLEKKCQAIKLAYKLRGQWLAWRLAGLFLDGATSNILGYGYTKLPHDASSSVNQ
ncbi:uncharacterized protein [Hetaerina americana]|uniref:uncharacterized protein n=1 Tax=Hetaerina americana TaxID=62018 RepID=UPI003A7F23B5